VIEGPAPWLTRPLLLQPPPAACNQHVKSLAIDEAGPQGSCSLIERKKRRSSRRCLCKRGDGVRRERRAEEVKKIVRSRPEE
jgi:hypothetical protein